MMQAFKLRLVDVNGRVWHLNDPNSPVRVRHGGWPGVSAKVTQQTIPLARGGRRVVPGRGRVADTSGTLTVGLYPGVGVDLRRVRRRWIDGWSFDEPCQLQVVGKEREGKYTLPLRLDGEREIPQPATINFDVFQELAMPVVVDRAVWASKRTRAGDNPTQPTVASITNTGVSTIGVSLEWGTGGRVTLPSGASFALPYTAQRRIITLDRSLSYPVTDLNGVEDKAMQERLWGVAMEETIKPKQTKVFTGPPGSVFRYELEVKEPWR